MRDTPTTFCLGFPGPKRYTCSIPSERPAAAHTIERVRQVSIPLFLGRICSRAHHRRAKEQPAGSAWTGGFLITGWSNQSQHPNEEMATETDM